MKGRGRGVVKLAVMVGLYEDDGAEPGKCMGGDENDDEVMVIVLMILSAPQYRHHTVSTRKRKSDDDDVEEEGIENGKETEIVVQSKGKWGVVQSVVEKKMKMVELEIETGAGIDGDAVDA